MDYSFTTTLCKVKNKFKGYSFTSFKVNGKIIWKKRHEGYGYSARPYKIIEEYIFENKYVQQREYYDTGETKMKYYPLPKKLMDSLGIPSNIKIYKKQY